MSVQDMAPQEKQLKHKFSTWLIRGALALTIAITIALIVLVIWLFKTQNLTQFSTWIGILAGIAAFIPAPLLLFFAIVKWPEKEKEASIDPQPQPQLPVPPVAPPTDAGQTQTIFHIPYRPNPFFTGREQLLERLHNNLTARKAAALTQAQAINGLGGIGKTQIAIEYAYHHREDYHYIFWVNADTLETLISDYVAIAKHLHLPAQNEQNQNKIVTAVIAWLATQNDCLLILDNADDLHMIDLFVPTANRCHILITTREQATGSIANSIEVRKMESAEGTLMLLRRAKILVDGASIEQASEEGRNSAEKIVQEMDGLPLALDQAGAYIEEKQSTPTSYLATYRSKQAQRLQERGQYGKDHPDPVTITWSLNFEQVEQHNPLAGDLMRCCAFLAPDDIPEELFTEGASDLSPLLQPIATDPSLLDEAIGALRRFSLVRRNPDISTFSIHRLVQAILRIDMDEATQKLWAERAVRIVNDVFPRNIDVTNWKQCQRYVTHAQTCATFIEKYDLAFPEAALLLNQTANYLKQVALYTEAEPLYQRAIAIGEKTLGPDHPDLATYLNNLAGLYDDQGKYEQAEPRYLRAIAIDEKTLGPEHPQLATHLNNLAVLYQRQDKYEQAEPLFQRALQIVEKRLGSDHPTTVTFRKNYARFLEKKEAKK